MAPPAKGGAFFLPICSLRRHVLETPGSSSDQLLVIYDGACPFCSRYADLTALRACGVPVLLRNGRDADLHTAYPEAADYDLDEGMLVRWRGRWSHGAAAVATISAVVRGAPMAAGLRHARLARLAYPLLRFGRNLALRAKGVEPIARHHRKGRGD